MAPDRSGAMRPAYARFVFFHRSQLRNERLGVKPSDTDSAHSIGRVGFALLGRMGSNAF